MNAVGAWVAEQRRVYFDNAPMLREYRSQLRSPRAPWLLVGYLFVLVAMASIFYWGISAFAGSSAAEAQRQLNGFFVAVVAMLEFLVGLAAPVIAASSVVGEYQTRMIDLVFSSPMSSKYFLVGKLVSSYRYVLLLLVMSLPVAAVSVVLGGATWADVLSAYLLVSFHGLLYMAVSLPIAVMTGKAVPTVLWSYIAVGAFSILASLLSIGGFGGPTSGTVPLFSGLSPFVSGVFAGLKTSVGPWSVPVWVPAFFVTLLVVKVLMLGAATVLTQAGSKESFSLRIHGVLLALCVAAMYAMSAGAMFGGRIDAARQILNLSLPVFVFLPYLSNWSTTGGGKTWPNGLWSFRWMLRGTPASGLPYLTVLVLSLVVGYYLGSGGGAPTDAEGLVKLAGVFGYWALAWSLGWLASGLVATQTADVARRLHLLLCFAVFVLPLVLLLMLEGVSAIGNWGLPAGWTQRVNVLDFLTSNMGENGLKVAILFVLAGALGWFGESRRRRAVERVQRTA